eukprot:TRINITY_DN19403_c0_g1_i2.p1 TRINITY_DN19403_c0_g1~~TRINITY_DN19403_c0_g1_i2.p1  ORF type:complete len:1109 (+),score=182.23 TRINITY_DN19403_c0_g1_i2:90-3416(+)
MNNGRELISDVVERGPGKAKKTQKFSSWHHEVHNLSEEQGVRKGYHKVETQGLKQSLRRLRTRGHEGRAQCVTANGNLDHIVSGGSDGTMRLWKFCDFSKSYCVDSIVLHYTDGAGVAEETNGHVDPDEENVITKSFSMAKMALGLQKEVESHRCGVTAVHCCRSVQPYQKGDTVHLKLDLDFIKERIALHTNPDVKWSPLIKGLLGSELNVLEFDKAANVIHLDISHVDLAVRACASDTPRFSPRGICCSKTLAYQKILPVPAECIERAGGEHPPLADGPIISGTSNGDVTVLCPGTQVLEYVPMLHKQKAVNSITAIPFEGATESQPDRKLINYLILTAGDDGDVAMLDMTCLEAAADSSEAQFPKKTTLKMASIAGYTSLPSLLEQDPTMSEVEMTRSRPHQLVSIGIRRTERGPIRLCHGDTPVLMAKGVGDLINHAQRVSIATLTAEEGVWLWNLQGDYLMKLDMNSHPIPVHTWVVEADRYQAKLERATITKYTNVSVTTSDTGGLLFATGVEGDDSGDGDCWTGVWYINDGKVLGTVTDKEKDYIWTTALEEYKRDKTQTIKPITAYKSDRTSHTAVEKSGNAAGFVVDIRDDSQATLWDFEGCSPSLLAVSTPTPASLLMMSGQQTTRLEMVHKVKVTALDLARQSDGPQLLTACEDGTLFAWDLEGRDEGQVIAEVRSLSVFEIVMPPVLRFITTCQVLAFAFGPKIPGVPNSLRVQIHGYATGDAVVPLMRADLHMQIADETVFWVKAGFLRSVMSMFIALAMSGAPELCDVVLRQVEGSVGYQNELEKGAEKGKLVKPYHHLHRVIRGVAVGVKFFMRLCTTVLAVPIANALADAADCIPQNPEHREPCFLSGACHLEKAPGVICYRDEHMKMVFTMLVIVPLYFFLLVPYAVCNGDAKYVPRSTLYDWKIWKDNNMWRKAAQRKATSINLGLLHPEPAHAFLTFLWELVFKTMLPVITTLCSHLPKTQAMFVTILTGFHLTKTLVIPPFQSGRYTLVVQSFDYTILNASLCGLITCFMPDDSNIPVYYFIVSFIAVLTSLCMKMARLQAKTEFIHVYATPQPSGGDRFGAKLAPTAAVMNNEGDPGSSYWCRSVLI